MSASLKVTCCVVMSSPSSGPPLAARDLDASCTQNANTTRPRSRIRVPRTVGCPAPRFGRRKLVELRSDLRNVAIVAHVDHRSEEHTSELQSLMRISYAVFFLKK